MEATAKFTLNLEHFESVIVGALEGGSNYWYFINDTSNIPRYNDGYSNALSMRIARALYESPDFALDIHDLEDQDEKLGTITRQSLIDAFGKRPDLAGDIITQQDDAETADCLFQIAVLGEITFG